MENTSNSTTNQVPSQNGSVPNKANESESGNILQRHGGLIYGISSIIVSWWISSLVGLILGVFGAGLSLNEKSQSLRILGIICGIAGVLLGIYGLFM
ncbi:MAG: hypothetical protein LIO62_06660 [Clostridiales bacterium]|nr:hypothetical protein [Clostridiales bacterium]